VLWVSALVWVGIYSKCDNVSEWLILCGKLILQRRDAQLRGHDWTLEYKAGKWKRVRMREMVGSGEKR
jgi:hypothetical protein